VKSKINNFKTQNLDPKYTKVDIFRGYAPNPAGGAYSAPPDVSYNRHPTWCGGTGCPFHKNPTPLSALLALNLPFWPHRFAPLPLFELQRRTPSERFNPAIWLGQLLFAPWTWLTQPSILSGLANEYRLQLGR